MAGRISETLFLARVDATGIKAFVASLHLLQKIGRDLLLEVEEHAMTLRGLNDNKSSFAAIEFERAFFDEYNLNASLGGPFSGKLAVKPICMVLKNLKSVSHIVMAGVRCQAEFNITFQLHLKNSVIRSYYFCYEDCEIVNAVCDEAECSLIQMRPRVMAQLLDYIHRSPEILMIAKPGEFSVRSYHQTNEFNAPSLQRSQPTLVNKLNSVVSTGLSLSISELEIYDYRSAEDNEAIVFCMKEVDSFVAFCEVLDLQLFNFFFSTGGSAMKLTVSLDGFSVSLIMATLQHGINREIGDADEEAVLAAEEALPSRKRPAAQPKPRSKPKQPKKSTKPTNRGRDMAAINDETSSRTTDKQTRDEEETFFEIAKDDDGDDAGFDDRRESQPDESLEAEFDPAVTTTTGNALFANNASQLSIYLQNKQNERDDDDDEATIADEDENDDDASDHEFVVKRSRLNQHPKHRQFYTSGHNTEDDDTEEERDDAAAVVVKANRTGQQANQIDDDDTDEDIQVNKKRAPRAIPHSLMSSGGSDAIITAVVQQQLQQAQQVGKKKGARRLLDISDDESL